MLIGNLTRDPELRYTPSGTAVCTFGLATNRSWTPSDGGERKEETEFHRIVCWQKLAELCSQLLFKGRKAYVEGRLQSRSWTSKDGQERSATEIVIDNMIILDSKRREGEEFAPMPVASQKPFSVSAAPAVKPAVASDDNKKKTVEEKKKTESAVKKKEEVKEAPAAKAMETKEATVVNTKAAEEVKADDIPF